MPQAWFGHFYAIGACWNIIVATLFLRSRYYATLDSWGQVRTSALPQKAWPPLPAHLATLLPRLALFAKWNQAYGSRSEAWAGF
jgi:hypothetical protein